MPRLNSFYPAEGRRFEKARRPLHSTMEAKLDGIFVRLYREHSDRQGCASWDGDSGDGDATIFTHGRTGHLARVVIFRGGYVTQLWGRKEPA